MPIYGVTHTFKVYFKPKGTAERDAGEIRTVTFQMERPRMRSVVFNRAKQEAISEGVLSRYAIANYWEPFRFDILTLPPA